MDRGATIIRIAYFGPNAKAMSIQKRNDNDLGTGCRMALMKDLLHVIPDGAGGQFFFDATDAASIKSASVSGPPRSLQ